MMNNQADKAWMPVAGGILSLIVGLLSFIGSILAALVVSLFFVNPDLFGYGPGTGSFPVFTIWIAFLPYLAISVTAVIGGVYSIKRRHWILALTGAICAIFTVWAWAIGVAAVVLVALARKEFSIIINN